MIKQLNKNNFIIWTGEFKPPSFEAIANNDILSMQQGATEAAEIYPLNNDIATYGINPDTLEITLQDNPAAPAVWDAVAKKLFYYLPVDAVAGQDRVIKYRWRDAIGNYSNEGSITVTVTARQISYRPYAPSLVCLKNGNGTNTGQAFYQQLEQFFTDTGEAVSPRVLIANEVILPQYAPPTQAFGICPLPAQNIVLNLFNNSSFEDVVLLAISLFNQGEQVAGYSVFLGRDQVQPRELFVAPGSFDAMHVVTRNDYGRSVLVRYVPGDGGGGGNTIDVPGGGGGVAIFNNVTFGTDYAGDIIIR